MTSTRPTLPGVSAVPFLLTAASNPTKGRVSISTCGARWPVNAQAKPGAGRVITATEDVEKPGQPERRQTLSPLPWQFDPVRTLTDALNRGQSALDASDTGTGKTFVALFAAKAAGKRVAVICPKSVKPAWWEACSRVGVEILFIANIEALRADGKGFLRKTAKVWGWSLPDDVVLVFDEVHRFSGSDTENAKILAAAPSPCLMLSATAAQDPTKMRAIAHQLGLSTWRNWWQWCGRNGCKKGYWGGIEFKGTQANLDILHRQIFHTGRGVRVRVADLGSQFPENTVEAICVPVADQPAIDAAYLEELKALEAGAEQMTATLRARQISEHQKLPAIIELAEDLMAEGNSVVVFVNFRDSWERLHAAFNSNCSSVYGDQDTYDRGTEVLLFQENKTHLMICMIQAGGVGLSLHDLHGRPRVSIICPGWSAIELRQALGRIHRAGSKSPAIQKILFAAETIEDRIRHKVEAKLSRIDTINDGDLSAEQHTKPTMKNATIQRQTESQSLLPQVLNGNSRGNSGVPALHNERAHSKVSPSKLKSLEICPCYEDDTTRDVDPITAEGTLCHEALDSGDDSRLTTDEQRGWVKMCREFVAEQQRDYYAKAFREERLEILDGIWGFADLILLSEDETSGALIDYKFGQNSQEDTETNPAAQAYVLGIFQRWPKLETVDVFYLYPRRDEINHTNYTRADVAQIKLRIQTTVVRVKAGLERGVHPDVCQWCGAKATCPALHAAVLPIARRYAEHKELDLPEQPDLSLVKDPYTWGQLMRMAPVLEALADSIKHHAIEFRQQTGTEIPGYEMRSRTGRKTINNAILAWEVAQQEGISQQEFLSAVDVSAKRLADVAGEKAPRGQKAKKAAELEGKLRDSGCLEVGAESFYLARSR